MTAQPWPPEAKAYLRDKLPSLRRAWERCESRPCIVVAIHPDRDRDELPAALDDVDEVSAHSLARGRVLARLVVPELAARLDEQLGPGEVWCLVVGPTSAGIIVLAWPDGGELAITRM